MKIKYVQNEEVVFDAMETINLFQCKKSCGYISDAFECVLGVEYFISDGNYNLGEVNIKPHDIDHNYIILVADGEVYAEPIIDGKSRLLDRAQSVYINIDTTRQSILNICKEMNKPICGITFDKTYEEQEENKSAKKENKDIKKKTKKAESKKEESAKEKSETTETDDDEKIVYENEHYAVLEDKDGKLTVCKFYDEPFTANEFFNDIDNSFFNNPLFKDPFYYDNPLNFDRFGRRYDLYCY